MNVKLWAGVVSIIVVLSISGAYLSSVNSSNLHPSDDSSMYIVSRVNSEGSGIFANKANLIPREADGKISRNPDGTIAFTDEHRARWGGMTIGIPGDSTIQYMMLMDFVKNQLNMNLRPATENPQNHSVYYRKVEAGQMFSYFNGEIDKGGIDGGIIWEPHYQNLVQNYGAEGVLLTSELSEDHACCVIAANREFANNNPASLIRFLAAYLEGLEWMNSAIDKGKENPGDSDYLELIDIALEFTQIKIIGDNDNKDKAKNVIKESFKTVKYVSEIGSLKNDVRVLVDTYYQMDLVSNKPSDIGFKDSGEFADWLINDSFLGSVEDLDLEGITEEVTINLATLSADIHQLAWKVALEKKYFDKYKIKIKNTFISTGGGAVATLLQTADVDIGFLGAPPAIMHSINNAGR